MLRRCPAMLSRPVYIVGAGMVPVSRKQKATIKSMSAEAVSKALADCDMDRGVPSAMYVGNMMSGMLSHQQHLGPFVATAAGMDGIEAVTLEGCCGAGGAAVRAGFGAVMSGMHDVVAVVGVEQMTHATLGHVTKCLATASCWEEEGGQGETFVSLNGHLMSMYLKEYGKKGEDFAPFSINAHRNALSAEHACLKIVVTSESYHKSRVVTPPIRLLDASPVCDGAACLILSSTPPSDGPRVQVIGSAAATDILTVLDRPDPLQLRGVELSTQRAMAMAQVKHADIDIFELHDAYTIMACLSLEAAGFVPRGQGTEFAKEEIHLAGRLPISTFGGLKARGHPVGASGVYQAAESYLQLCGKGGANQAHSPKIAMCQSIGGAGGSVFTHILARA